jgi:nucleoid DNA-binding protein
LKATAYLLLLFYFPNLGKAIKIPAKTVAQFKAGKALSEKVNKKK